VLQAKGPSETVLVGEQLGEGAPAVLPYPSRVACVAQLQVAHPVAPSVGWSGSQTGTKTRKRSVPYRSFMGAFDSAKNHKRQRCKRQRCKRQSVTAKRQKSQTPKFV